MQAHDDFFNRKFKEIGVSLNEVQKQAVLHTEGALLLLASPGSGKTTTIIMRIGYLIEEKGVDPSRIKAVTFSRASAGDMKDRFNRFFPSLPPDCVNFSTIHSLAFEVVRDHFRRSGTSYELIEGKGSTGKKDSFNSEYPPQNKKLILRKLFKSIVGVKVTEDQLDELTTYISFIKNKLIPKEKWSSVACDVPNATLILEEYENLKQSNPNRLLLDYDDMLTIANDALRRNRELLGKYQGRYDYILTDESQDTSMVQHMIIEKLVQDHGNLCVVADDDQSIYGWRAAEPQYLLNFKKVYSHATILMMEQNYRSSSDIVNLANRFIKRNKDRYEKNMFTENPPHQPVTIKSLPDFKLQSKYLVGKISGVENFRGVAVLYRNNSSTIILLNEFDRAGIPFYIKDSNNYFFSHWIVKDILNFMRMTFNDKRPDILENIYTKFNGYITRQQMDELKKIDNNESVFDNLIHHVQSRDYQNKHLKRCKDTFRKMSGISPLKAIHIIRDGLGYEKILEKMCKRLGFRKENLLSILNTLEEIADTLETMEDFAQRLKHLESLMKTSKFNKNKNAVTLSTLHSSKGLEFKKVYMIDLIEGVIPSQDDISKYEQGDSEPVEEAVRLFYVGMTRAELDLELLSYKEKDGTEVSASEFVRDVQNILSPPKPIQRKEPVHRKEIPSNPDKSDAIKSVEQLKVGITVKHRVFGQGKILQLDGDIIEIRFRVGIKKLLVEKCIEVGVLETVFVD